LISGEGGICLTQVVFPPTMVGHGGLPEKFA
jgi:hypothetical protein